MLLSIVLFLYCLLLGLFFVCCLVVLFWVLLVVILYEGALTHFGNVPW